MVALAGDNNRDRIVSSLNWRSMVEATLPLRKKAPAEYFSSALNWNHWKLCGRGKEQGQLEECYLTRKESDLVIVTGPLGIGKTALTDSLQYRVHEDLGLLVRGSFSVSPSQPYGAFVEVFTDLVEKLQLKRDYTAIRSDIRQAIAESGAERFLISDGLAVLDALMIDECVTGGHSEEDPNLEEIEHSQAQQQTLTATDRQHRFVNAVTKIVQAINSVFPLVIVLDNLMWADSGSILLLESLCVTGNLSNTLLVATCRGDEVGFHNPLSVILRKMEDRGVRLTDISLQPLSIDDTIELILTLLGHDVRDESYRGIVRKIHQCTNGIPLLICELLGVLEKEGLDSEILHQRFEYGDYVDAKIRQIPSSKQVLWLIACLGGQAIHRSVLAELLPELTEEERNSSLMAAQEQGLIYVNSEAGEYSFVHGNIQSAVYNKMIPLEKRSSIHYDIAERLCALLSEEQIDENIFLVVNQYLQGGDAIPLCKKEGVAGLCLRAARKAAFFAAFSSAGDFIRFGVSLLIPRTKWRDCYGLTLALMNAAVELEFCNGNHDAVDEFHHEILIHSRTVMDAITSCTIHMSSLGSRNFTNEAIAEGLEVLERLGERIPRRMVMLRTVAGLMKIKRIMKQTTDKQILSLQPLKDARIQAASNILHLLFVYVFMQQSELIPLVSMRAIEITRQFGLNPMSAASFAIFGMVEMMIFEEYEEGYRCAKLALKLMDTINCRELTSRTCSAVYGFVSSYKEPIRDAIKPLDEAFKLNIVTGDVEMAITCKSLSLGNSLQAGLPLFQVVSAYRKLIDVCHLHKQRWNELVVRLSAQFAVNFSGQNPLNKPFELTGEFMTEKTVETAIVRENNEVLLSWLYFLKFMMSVYLCDLSISLESEALMKPLKKFMKKVGFYTRQQQAFHEGVLSCHLATAAPREKRMRRRTLLSRAQKRLHAMRSFASVCPANYQNKAIFLEAEIESLKKEKTSSEIIFLYEKAASLAKDEGFLHEQALALEKGGYHVLNGLSGGPTTLQARSLFIQAMEVYEAYGSLLKVDQLKKILSRLDDNCTAECDKNDSKRLSPSQWRTCAIPA